MRATHLFAALSAVSALHDRGRAAVAQFQRPDRFRRGSYRASGQGESRDPVGQRRGQAGRDDAEFGADDGGVYRPGNRREPAGVAARCVGGVIVKRPDQTARSQYAIYDLNRRVITMLGAVTLTQAGNTVNGGRLTMNLDTGRSVIDGSSVAGGSAGGSGASGGTVTQTGGRVTGTLLGPQAQLSVMRRRGGFPLAARSCMFPANICRAFGGTIHAECSATDYCEALIPWTPPRCPRSRPSSRSPSRR